MATENISNDKGDGNEGRSPVKEVQLPQQNPRPSRTWSGRVQDGKLYCVCDDMSHQARCITVKKNGPNKGRKMYVCHDNDQEKQCGFWVWVDDADEAREWLKNNGPPPRAPETPNDKGKGKEKELVVPTINKDTPWTLSKSKRKIDAISREVSDEDENGGPSESSPLGRSDVAEIDSDEFGDPGSPSRKAPKRAMRDTPGRVLEDRLQNAAAALPTPDTGKQPQARAEASGSRTSKELTRASTKLGEVIDLTEETTSDLTLRVLEELRSEGLMMKDSTKLTIGHLIDTEMEMHEAKMRMNQKTISRMKRRLDELESLVLALTGDEGDDAVQLSG